jgi:hypothetical protein
VPPVRWVADALTILSIPEKPVEWTCLVEQARLHELILPLRHALAYLVGTFDAPVPPAVLQELEAHRPSMFERVEQRMREWTSPSLGCFPLAVCHHMRVTRSAGPLAVVRRIF